MNMINTKKLSAMTRASLIWLSSLDFEKAYFMNMDMVEVYQSR